MKGLQRSIGRIFPFRENLQQVPFFDELRPFVDETHITSFTVRLYRSEELHTKAGNSAFVRHFRRDCVELTGKDDKATEYVVKHIVVVADNQSAPFTQVRLFLVFVINLSFEKQKL